MKSNNLKSRQVTFVTRIFIAVVTSLVINSCFYLYLNNLTTKNNYFFKIEVNYPIDGTLQFYYDTGNGFNEKNSINNFVKEGKSEVNFAFVVPQDKRLKALRIDFGNNPDLKFVEVNHVKLVSKSSTIFELEGKQVTKSISFSQSLRDIECNKINFATQALPFDPYINFSSIIDLVYPKSLQITFLVIPWLIVFIAPIFKFLRRTILLKNYSCFLVCLFIISLCLKIAWVSFTAILILIYALFQYYKRREFSLKNSSICLFALFIVSLVFVRNYNFEHMDIYLGFIILPIASMVVDFAKNLTALKKYYVNIFFILVSICIVNWFLLILFKGYFYNVNVIEYLINIKIQSSRMLSWLYFTHSTFVSFFVVVGIVFNHDLMKKSIISKNYYYTFIVFSTFFIFLSGSRFSIIILLLLPFLFLSSLRGLKSWLLPFTLLFSYVVFKFIPLLDAKRNELWKVSINIFEEKKWFGHGIGSSKELLFDYFNNHNLIDLNGLNHSHNQYLTFLIETGLVGTFMYLSILICLFLIMFRYGDRSIIVILTIIILLMLFESPFKTATPLYFISFVISIFPNKFLYKK